MSPPRKFSGKIKPGMGIDGTEGESFTKRSGDPWDSNPKGNKNTGGELAAYTNNESGLRQKLPDEDPDQGTRSRGGGTDLWDAVEGQSSDAGNRAVRSRGQD
jgi:hypothetical protein